MMIRYISKITGKNSDLELVPHRPRQISNETTASLKAMLTPDINPLTSVDAFGTGRD